MDLLPLFFIVGELQPGADCDSDDKIDEFIKRTTDTAYHASCTCKMGTDAMSVTDNQGRVSSSSCGMFTVALG